MNKKLLAGFAMGIVLCGISGIVEATPVAGITSFTNHSIYLSESHSLGYKFTINNDVTITALGFFDAYQDGLSSNHLVGLWDSNQTLLSSVELFAGTGSSLIGDFRYENMTTVINLTAGESYFIAGTTMSDNWVYQADNISTDSSISYDSSYFSIFTGYNLVFPGTAASSREYMTVNFLMDTSPVPEPATMLLFSTGLVGLVGSRLRKKKK